jgi:phospholipid transport system substrate-binding protein
MKHLTWVAAIFALLAGIAVADLKTGEPVSLVEQVNVQIYAKVTENLSAYQSDNEALKSMVREDLLPLVDTQYAARLILGRAGRGLPKEKIDRFETLMSELLVNRYATGLLDYNSEVKLEVLPQRGPLNEKATRVRTRVTLPSGAVAPVDYAFRKTAEGWKAFDVIVEGISYVTTFRNQIMPEVEANGIDSVIERLSRGELELTD